VRQSLELANRFSFNVLNRNAAESFSYGTRRALSFERHKYLSNTGVLLGVILANETSFAGAEEASA